MIPIENRGWRITEHTAIRDGFLLTVRLAWCSATESEWRLLASEILADHALAFSDSTDRRTAAEAMAACDAMLTEYLAQRAVADARAIAQQIADGGPAHEQEAA